MAQTLLSVLDLVPLSSGATTTESVGNAIDLAQRCEDFGYRRYWFAEHHLNPGVGGTSPAVMIALVAPHTSRIRLGSAGVQMGHRTALSVVEEFGLLDSLFPGRLDLGLGRSGGRGFTSTRRQADPTALPADAGDIERAPNGLPIPLAQLLPREARSPRMALNRELLQQPHAETPDYAEQVRDIADLLAGTWTNADGIRAEVIPGQGADVTLWILGSSPGLSAQTAGARGLHFAANYHVSPGTVLEAVDAYREAFRPSAGLDRPYVAVSADVVVGEDDETATELATGYGLWVRSIRTGEGTIAFPTPDEARRHRWTETERAIVSDRVATQIVGSPQTVAAGLDLLADATGADELVITTITHDHADRVRSYELLAKEWFGRS